MGFNQKNVDAINAGFEYKCIFVLIECYRLVKDKKEYNLSWEEEQFSAILINSVEYSDFARKWNIDVVPEHRLYTDDILKGKKLAKSASRIDMRFAGWVNQKKQIYFIEAKNLCEHNWIKNDGVRVDASKLHYRYIDTGIFNFLNEYYPRNGCLAGYILEGNPDNVVEKINAIIRSMGQYKEILVTAKSINNHSDICNSFHILSDGKELILKHIFLKF